MLNTTQPVSHAMVETLSKKRKEPAWLQQRRLEAFRLFQQLPMPNFKYGLGTKLNVQVELAALPLNQRPTVKQIVQDQQEAEILTLWEAIQKYPELLKEKLFSCFQPTEKFPLLHTALLHHGIVIRIPKNTEIQVPIQITTEVESDALFTHVLILAEPNAKATILEKAHSPTREGIGFHSKVVEIIAAEGSHIDYGNIQDLGRHIVSFTQKKAAVGKEATVNWMECIFGSKITQSVVTSFLEGEGGKSNNWGMFFGDQDQQFDLAASTIHKARNTVSDMLTKGVLNDSAKAIYRGLVRIEQEAPGSNGYQKADTLLLTNTAEADNIPSLEIDNSEVRCTHGSTIGQVDKEQLFYLMARGLPEQVAIKEIVRGFFYPMIEDKIEAAVLQEYLKNIIDERLA